MICGGKIPQGMQVCGDCMKQFSIKAGEAVEIAEGLRDISGILSITANTDRNIKDAMESILRMADRLEGKGNGDGSRTKEFAASSIGKAENSSNI